jgi:hypothetical protein
MPKLLGMIKTLIMLGLEDNFPVWHKSQGIAKSLKVARWIFAYCGWESEQDEFPDLAHVEETIDWPEGDQYFSCNTTELWVLGSCLQMN